MSFWDSLDSRYRLILCDVWGVVHDGVRLSPGAAERLRDWRGQGRFVILLTIAPRTADSVKQQLARLGLPGDCRDAVVTSGEAGIAALLNLREPVGFLGTADDRSVLESRHVPIADGEEFADLACTGLQEGRPEVSEYRADLERWAARRVRLHCLNPDRLVMHGGAPEACAGAIADAYEALGSPVCWYGKPYEPIYRHALSVAGNPPPEQVLAIGDALGTDMLGAARMGFDAVFVSNGIHGGEPFPPDFAARHRLGDWRPVALVDGLT
jgi:HAD superfamily hydrolase (TIGR01459 family)